MKRFIAVLSGMLVLPAFAEVAPVYYDDVIEYTDDATDDAIAVQPKAVAQRDTINRSTSASRAVSSAAKTASARTNTSSRAVASSRSGANVARTTTSRAARTNTVANVRARGTATRPVTARVGVNGAVASAPRSAHTYTTQVNADYIDGTTKTIDDTTVQYNPSRVGMRVTGRGQNTGVARLSSVVSATTPVVTEADVSATTSNLNAIAELTDHCKAQYASCMDNYCNVLDDNQGRCSCSKNLKNYEKTEATLSKATEEFQEVVQKIRYIGLTGPQVEALFAETEAELAMKSNSDTSQLKSSLDAIKRKIVDVSTPSSSAVQDTTSGLTLDMNGLLNADFTAGFDLNSFLNVNKTNTTSVTNQRGEQLYKSATSRCKTAVLNSCTSQGIDANVITNAYDLEIDKQCVAYERALNEANKEMKNNVFNATNILQQARLLLTQNKNSYDLRGCVAAIDACMQDEYVCGADYELCLDPTSKYLANGEIVKGGTPGISGGQSKNTDALTAATLDSWLSKGMYDLYSTWNYGSGSNAKNAWGRGANENLGGYIDEALTTWKSQYAKMTDATKSDNLALYLLQKVGYVDENDKVHGLCASAMKQCQDYTFETKKSKKTYIPDNEVVRQYLNSTLAKIKVQQDAILADYAEGCRGDVQSCLTTNGYDDSNTSTTASQTAVNACAAEIKTCMSVGGYMPKDGTTLTLRAMRDWVASMLMNCPVDYYLVDDGVGDGTAGNVSGNKVQCKVCPTKNGIQTTSTGGQSMTCTCPDGYKEYYAEGKTHDLTNMQCIPEDANTNCPTVSKITVSTTTNNGTTVSLATVTGTIQTEYNVSKKACMCPTVNTEKYWTRYIDSSNNVVNTPDATHTTIACEKYSSSNTNIQQQNDHIDTGGTTQQGPISYEPSQHSGASAYPASGQISGGTGGLSLP